MEDLTLLIPQGWTCTSVLALISLVPLGSTVLVVLMRDLTAMPSPERPLDLDQRSHQCSNACSTKKKKGKETRRRRQEEEREQQNREQGQKGDILNLCDVCK
jgi:hypothetical protein